MDFDRAAFEREMRRLKRMNIPVLEGELMWIARVVSEESANTAVEIAAQVSEESTKDH
jgi:hypothetical protein